MTEMGRLQTFCHHSETGERSRPCCRKRTRFCLSFPDALSLRLRFAKRSLVKNRSKLRYCITILINHTSLLRRAQLLCFVLDGRISATFAQEVLNEPDGIS
jgi:hypothetical protein